MLLDASYNLNILYKLSNVQLGSVGQKVTAAHARKTFHFAHFSRASQRSQRISW